MILFSSACKSSNTFIVCNWFKGRQGAVQYILQCSPLAPLTNFPTKQRNLGCLWHWPPNIGHSFQANLLLGQELPSYEASVEFHSTSLKPFIWEKVDISCQGMALYFVLRDWLASHSRLPDRIQLVHQECLLLVVSTKVSFFGFFTDVPSVIFTVTNTITISLGFSQLFDVCELVPNVLWMNTDTGETENLP